MSIRQLPLLGSNQDSSDPEYEAIGRATPVVSSRDGLEADKDRLVSDTESHENIHEKACSRCGSVQPLSGFSRSARYRDGHVAACKVCLCAKAREYGTRPPRLNVVEIACSRCGTEKPTSAFYRRRGTPTGYTPHCKACQRVMSREYRARPVAKARHTAHIVRMRERYPERHRARMALSSAIARGRITPGPCEVGADCAGRIEGHHDDYSRPLDVRWLCERHHHAHHADSRARAYAPVAYLPGGSHYLGAGEP